MEINDNRKRQRMMRSWGIQKLLENKKLIQAAKKEQENANIGQSYLRFLSTKEDLDKQVEELDRYLNNNAKIIWYMAYSKACIQTLNMKGKKEKKQQQNEKVTKTRKTRAKTKNRLSGDKKLIK